MDSSSLDAVNTLSALTNLQQMDKTIAVRVGVRVRPFSSKEISASSSCESVLKCIREGTQEIRLGTRRFTYDAVFDESVTQEALYQSVAGPLMLNFLEGFNATIMAYGQTGSGKTYTMGSEAHDGTEISSQTGIIPRFMRDLFANLLIRKEASDSASNEGPVLIEYKMTASFLEVYGEDVHDLLVPSRPSVPVREDANGGIVCAGLTEFPIATAQDALQVLHEGTMHRTTAATLMNLTSSRSHAVFAVTLTQRNAVSVSGEATTTVSRLTFVDLAGSERMKKTGAEGERAREGIKINEGLLALGNVINALADQKRISEGKKVHVPYRQSKLTRLLQDALGGNSQTLFLACVSPSDTNASETLSTLHYANRARNIRNAPVQNIDASMVELRKLRAWSQILQNELLRHKFGVQEESDKIGILNDEILLRGEVQQYLQELQSIALQENSNANTNSALTLFPMAGGPRLLSSPSPVHIHDATSMDIDASINQSVIENVDPALLSEVNPDHEMAILNQLIELQHRDQAFDDEQRRESDALEKMEGELAEQESMLLQLRDSLKVYHNIKNKYENLMAEVQQLEVEKAQLAAQLEKATVDPTQGCSSAIQKELDKVEKSLARARNETRRHREQYRKLEREAQKCQVLERKITELKSGRAAMMKKQRDAAARHREFTEAKTREIMALKRKEQTREKKVSKLQSEVRIHKRNLEKRQQFIQKLNDKLKQTETHLMKLLSTRQRSLQDRMSVIHHRSSIATSSSTLPLYHDETSVSCSSEVKSLGLLIARFIDEKASHFQLDKQHQRRVDDYASAMKDMVSAVDELRKLKNEEAPDQHIVSEALQQVEDSELKVELISAEVDSLKSQMKETHKLQEMQMNLSKVIEAQPSSVLRALMIGLIDKQISAEQQNADVESTLQRKERTIVTLEQEIDLLNQKIIACNNEGARRQQLANSNGDPHTFIQSLIEEKMSLSAMIQEKEEELADNKDKLGQTQQTLVQISIQTREAQQQIAVMKVAEGIQAHTERALTILYQVQSIWREIGETTESEDDVLRSIENCLEDTCARKLSEIINRRDNVVSSIETVEEKVKMMENSLAVSPSIPTQTFPNLLAKKAYWDMKMSELFPRFAAARTERDEIARDAVELKNALELAEQDIPINLQNIMENQLADAIDLSEDFLKQCRDELSGLRVKKAEIIVENSMKQKKIREILHDMNIAENATKHFVMGILQGEEQEVPEWWETETVDQIIAMTLSETPIPKASKLYTKHLVVVHAALDSVANRHRSLSECLQDLIERAQETLLNTVQGGHDAVEACASFRDALLRLPKLSKERIETCLSQITDLISGVDAMIQSEIEALMVVWEALGTPTADRGMFWETVDESLPSEANSPFDKIISKMSYSDSWLKSIIQRGMTCYTALDKKLFKLRAVHREVESLRARQDAKSKVLSLDSEVRLLNAQLAEFEENQCSKDRLLSRQTVSSQLLREERYRKQMKAKFTSKLEQLSELLKVWNEKTRHDFDPNILSEDVRMLLQNASWIDHRKEFMHLRTIKSSRAGKRRIERIGSNDSDSPSHSSGMESAASNDTQPVATAESAAKRVKATAFGRSLNATTDKTSSSRSVINKRKANEAKPAAKPDPKKRRTVAALPQKHPHSQLVSTSSQKTDLQTSIVRVALSPQPSNIVTIRTEKVPNQNKRMTLPPFGHVLEQSSTPRSKSATDENLFQEG